MLAKVSPSSGCALAIPVTGSQCTRRVTIGYSLASVHEAHPVHAQRFCREALVWCQLKHSFILPFYGLFRECIGALPDHNESEATYMVSPWMLNSTLSMHVTTAAYQLHLAKNFYQTVRMFSG
jgi:hypothetical protein